MDMLATSRTPTRVPDLEAEVVRALEAADLAKPAVISSHLKRIGQRHHMLARCLAQGMANYEAAFATGYSPVRISILKSDPLFKELVTSYVEKREIVLASFNEKLVGIADSVADIIIERVEEKPDEITINQAMALIELTADRTGFGPSSSHQHNHTHGIADRLEAARKRGQEARQIELKAITEKPDDS